MKIAVTASSPNLDDPLDPRFGRCPYFLIVDTETMAAEAVENPFIEASGGAGIQAGQLIASKGVKAVLTGSCGPNAFQTLSAAGIEVVTGAAGTPRKAVEQYLSGRNVQAAGGPNAPAHYGMRGAAGFGGGMTGQGTAGGGMGRGAGRGLGQGMGRGMGRGQGPGQGMGRGMGGGMGAGQGMGRGMGRGMGAGRMAGTGGAYDPADVAPPVGGTALDQLKREARTLQDQLKKITARISELEKTKEKE